jgi:extradiol dioxygenase family protein
MTGSCGFHLSLVTEDLPRQRRFYTELLGCKLARVGPDFEDYDFFGNQLTFHQRAESLGLGYETLHFGAMLDGATFEHLYARLRAAQVQFVIEPALQAAGSADERRKLVCLDPSGYAIEFKSYVDESRVLVPEPAYARVPKSE